MNTSAKISQATHSSNRKAFRYNVPSLLQDWKQKLKAHHYQTSGMGTDFVLEASPDSAKEFYMTSHKAGVKKTDSIRIHGSSSFKTYEVLDVDYYSDPSDMWTARLVRVS